MLETRIGALTLPNPVLLASGTCGYGEELAPYLDLSKLGGVIGKTVTRLPRAGNAPPRTCETPSGMLNAIGLQNVGVERFIAEKLPLLRELGTNVVVNVAGETVEDFAWLVSRITDQPGVNAFELNISCPNVAHGLDFSTIPELTEDVVRRCRDVTSLPLIAKLSPNVTDIRPLAQAAEQGGADALSVANTFVGMAVNIHTRKPRLTNITGGLSGPAIRPLALRAVYLCSQAVQIPIIGAGGISTWQDAAEFLIAGATAIQVGTATFVQPTAALGIIDGLRDYLIKQKLRNIAELVGSLSV